jgi:hypothetical protein
MHRIEFLRRIAVFVATAFLAVGQTDRVRLKSGSEFEGRVLFEKDGVLRLAFEGGHVDLRRDQIAEVVRATRDPAKDADLAILSALRRVPDGEDWFFLYRDGARVGWRGVVRTREVRDGVAGYLRVDRRAFTKRGGGPTEVEIACVEFEDADLRPRYAERRVVSGADLRATEIEIDGGRVAVREKGSDIVRRAPFDATVEFLGSSTERVAREAKPTDPTSIGRYFDVATASFLQAATSRSLKRARLDGRVADVVVVRRATAEGAVETWFDLFGRPLREELGGPDLVATRTTAERVAAFVAGRDDSGDDLGLKLSFDAAGLSLVKPDASWEAAAGDLERSRLGSLACASLRATCDVFELPISEGDEDAACFEAVARVEAGVERADSDGPERASYGETRGVRFLVDGRRRGTLLRTLGFVVARGDRAYVFLCAAPATEFGAAAPVFERLLSSVRFEEPEVRKEKPRSDVDG